MQDIAKADTQLKQKRFEKHKAIMCGTETHNLKQVVFKLRMHENPHLEIDEFDDQHNETSSRQQVLRGVQMAGEGVQRESNRPV